MSLLEISSQRLGRGPDCSKCGAGGIISFNWKYASTAPRAEFRKDLTVFVSPEQLRWGTLFRCESCGHPWYLDGEERFMNCVPRDRLALIHQWNQQPIVLSSEQIAKLKKIGRTPADIYGNGAQFHLTPCTVVTKSGQQIDVAIVSQQRHAPFEYWRQCRLATEIGHIDPSPHALPLSIRAATAEAKEMRMGFSPTVAKTPDGETIIFNGPQNFFVKEGCSAGKVVLSKKRINWNKMPHVYPEPKNIEYFVADLV
jgi:hypothetical protein